MSAHLSKGLATAPRWEVWLDGHTVEVPHDRQTLAGIHTYLETLALQQQRLLHSFEVEGAPAEAAPASECPPACQRILAQTMALESLPLSLIQTARRQTLEALTLLDSTLVLVTINAPARARELWWAAAETLKQPVLTLSLLSEASLGLSAGKVGWLQLRKWQLEQLGEVIQDVDRVAAGEDPVALSEAMEHRVLPWLQSLKASLDLLHETFLAGLECQHAISVQQR